MNILIIPKIYSRFKNQIEYSIEKKLILFTKKIFPKANIKIAISDDTNSKIDLIILSGGNNIISFSKKSEDLLRNQFDNFFFKLAIKKKIPLLGICHGAQFIAKKFGCKFSKSKKHIGNHVVNFYDDKLKINEEIVNSYHDIIIKKESNKLDVIAKSLDNSVEAFCHKRLNIGGIIWHPERFKKFRILDIKLIKEFYATGNFSFWKRK